MKKRLYLISYDIANPRRLRRVGRYMTRHACRVQYSVFAAELTPLQLQNLLAGLESLIDARQDDIRAYPLPNEGEVALMGQQMFPDDVMLLRDGRNLLRLNARSDVAD